MAQLTGEQKARLRTAISGAFAIDQLPELLVGINQELERIVAPGDNLGVASRKVIDRAEKEGWTAALLGAIREARPHRDDVQALVAELLPQAEAPEPHIPPTERVQALAGRITPPAATLPWAVTSLALGCALTYFLLLSVLIPKSWWPAGPVIDASLTAAPTPTATPTLPPVRRLVLQDENLQPMRVENRLITIRPGQTVTAKIEPPLGETDPEYVWSAIPKGELIGSDPSERQLRIPDLKPGEQIVLTVSESDPAGGAGKPVDFWVLRVANGE